MRETANEYVFGADEALPFRSCHASTVASTADGGVFAAWFGGTREKAPDVCIYGAKRIHGKWGSVRLLARHELAQWNPVLFARGGEMRLWYKAGVSPQDWTTFEMRSRDGGESFSAPERTADGERFGRGPVKNKPIVLSDGTWLAPASAETEESWRAFVDISEDGGESWRMCPFVPADHGVRLIQPTLWESGSGVHMLLRSNKGRIYRSDSTDGGNTFCKAYPTELPNNNSGIDLAKLPDGKLLLVCNPVSGDWAARSPLTLSLSRDDGATWKSVLTLEDEPGCEFSYPSIITEGWNAHIVYTFKRETIRYRRIGFGPEGSSNTI